LMAAALTSNDKVIRCNGKITDITFDIRAMLKALPGVPSGDMANHWDKLNRKVLAIRKLSVYTTNISCTHEFKIQSCDDVTDFFVCPKCSLQLQYMCIDKYREGQRIG